MAQITVCDICGNQIKNMEEHKIVLPHLYVGPVSFGMYDYEKFISLMPMDACEECCMNIIKALDGVVDVKHRAYENKE